MYTNSTLRIIQDNAPYTDNDGTKYPSNYPKDEISELHKVTEINKPTGSNIVVNGFYIDENYTQVWNVRDKTEEELIREANAKKLDERQQALEAIWADPFDLLDDILNRGIDVVKQDRDAIKAAHPKP